MTSSSVYTIDIPCWGVYNKHFVHPKKGDGRNENVLVNTNGNRCSIKSLKRFLFQNNMDDDREQQLDLFVLRFNKSKGLWRPINHLTTQSPGAAKAEVFVDSAYTAGHLIHTGPYNMRVGDVVYCIPPLPFLTHQNGVPKHPFNYRVRSVGDDLFDKPFLLSEHDGLGLFADIIKYRYLRSKCENVLFQEAIGYWRQIHGWNLSVDYFAHHPPHSKVDSVFDRTTVSMPPDSKLGQSLGKNTLVAMDPYRIQPCMGKIIRREGHFDARDIVRPGDEFIIKWDTKY